MNKGEMSVIVKTIAGFLFPIAMIFSFYVIMHGHLTPGGGFQGGAVGASAIALLIVAFGIRYVEKKSDEEKISLFESIGGIIFVLVSLIGIFLSATFLTNFLVGEEIFGKIPSWGEAPLNSGGILPILNIAVGMKVIGGLSSVLIIIALAVKEVEE
ncbi:MAG: sodium:proton antiporter [Thermoplasmatales archaeon]|nr:sodium:proton antiporter [Thermoplasmatales archaeon]